MKRKKKLIILSIASVIFFALIFLFVKRYVEEVLRTDISFNHESGFYEEEFDLEISTGRAYYITYTLDGTDPTIYSERYEGPIHIKDASDNDNIWSMWKEMSPGYFNKESIYSLPREKVDKCLIVRATAFDNVGNAVSSSMKSYFIGYQDKVGYDNLYTVCVTTEPVYLFEDNVGIYTMGSRMREFIDSGEADDYDWESGWKKAREANWFIDGIQSERVAAVQIFDEDNKLILDDICGIRVRGHDSRHDPQKSLGIYSRDEYSGKERFDYDFFDDGIGPKSFVVFNSGDDGDVKIRDYIIHRLEKEAESKFTTSTFIPCNMFLQGEYWGPMYIMEDLNSDFLSIEYGVSQDNIRLIKADALKANDAIVEISTDMDDWEGIKAFIRDNDMSNNENYEYVCSQIDMESFIDYAASEIYIGNTNWKEDNNSAEWRSAKREANNEYADCKWRFCLYDVNDSLRNWGEETPLYFKRALDLQPTVRNLAKNENFERDFRNRVKKLETIYSTDNVEKCIEDWRAIMGTPLNCYYERFTDTSVVNNPIDNEIESILDFVEKRPAQMEILFEQMFD